MDHNHCRALILYTPRVTFLSLPREIRDEIYHLSLVSSKAIIPWAGVWRWEYIDWDNPCNDRMRLSTGRPSTALRYRVQNHTLTTMSLQHLSKNLLICGNIRIAEEAAQEFYSKNVFRFDNDHQWDTVVAWLEGIGRNRIYLKDLEIFAARPYQVWQQANGQRSFKNRTSVRDLYPRHPYLRAPSGGEKEGFVDMINPIIERIFILLARASEKNPAITISLLLPVEVVPGVEIDLGEAVRHFPGITYFGMDLPNLIEKFRILHSKDSVEVLWKGDAPEPQLIQRINEIEAAGWDIKFAKTKDTVFRLTTCGNTSMPFILKHRNLAELLIAQDPRAISPDNPGLHYFRS